MTSRKTQQCAIAPMGLLCEYREDPMGVQETAPRLSWIQAATDPTARGVRQTAYQIAAASSLEKLMKKPDLWDTGKVVSTRTSQIEYPGKSLTSNMGVYWRVRGWDQNGVESAWSRPARWTMGLLQAQDWKASWVEAPDPLHFGRCMWVWLPEQSTADSGAKGRVACFQKVVEIPAKARLARATAYVAAAGHLAVFVNGKEVGHGSARDCLKEPSTIDLTNALQPGRNVVCVTIATDGIVGQGLLAGKLVVRYADQCQETQAIDPSWRCALLDRKDMRVLSQEQADWSAAVRVGGIGYTTSVGTKENPWGAPGSESDMVLPTPAMFRTEFKLKARPVRVLAYATALGLYRMSINGARVGADFLTPGWSDYTKRVYANCYDVTELVCEGANGLGAVLADGWYTGHVAWGRRRDRYGAEPRLMVQLLVEYADGATETIGSGKRWKVTTNGPWREADLLMGAVYDAQLEQDGWDCAGFNDASWKPVVVSPAPEAIVENYPTEPVRAYEEIRPVATSEPKPGAHVFDLGQNMVGVVRLKASGPAGTRITIRHAEVLNADGTLYTQALRSARAADTYIKRTDDEEVWTPELTSHGFRYVELSGTPKAPGIDAVTGIVLHSGMQRAGTLTTSNEMVNRLYQNIVWGQKGNYVEVPTDCPQRDERLGWTGDAQIFIRTGTFNYNVAAFFTKWMRDMFDSQTASGFVNVVCPMPPGELIGGEMWSGAWADAAIICPWTMYRVYGDTRIVQRYYPQMKRYMDYLKSIANDHILPDGGFGDWVSLHADTPRDLVNTAYYAYDAQLMAEMADAIGEKADGKAYRKLYASIREAFIKKYLKPGDMLTGNTQTAYVLALRFGLLPPETRPNAMQHLVRDLAYRGGHFSTGFVGLKDLMPALSEQGRDDLAYRILLKDDFPSWGYEVRNGATTVWERWDGWNEELGLQTPEMNSFNHYSFGAVGEWMFTKMAGIDMAEPEYRSIVIRPRPTRELRYVRAEYCASPGWIAAEWSRDSGILRVACRVPVGTTARVHVPCAAVEDVTENGRTARGTRGIKTIGYEDGCAVFEVGSGHYEFSAPDRA